MDSVAELGRLEIIKHWLGGFDNSGFRKLSLSRYRHMKQPPSPSTAPDVGMSAEVLEEAQLIWSGSK